jgi:hypothetical protein
VKAITLHQPWASLIADGLKQYETRHWRTNYRGKLLIHAAKRTFSAFGAEHKIGMKACELAGWGKFQGRTLNYCGGGSKSISLPLGAVVAVAELQGCYEIREGVGPTVQNFEPPHYTPGECFIYSGSRSELELAVGDWTPGRYAWRLENVLKLPRPIPCRGFQQLCNCESAVLREVADQALEVAANG